LRPAAVPSSAAKASRRLFFALWPDAALRDGLVQRRRPLEARLPKRVPDHNLHLTVLFLGNQPGDWLEAIEDAADAIRSPSFELLLDRFGEFERARVVWLGGAAPEAGRGLAETLERSMRGLGLDFDRRPWVPHVTLFRKVDDGRNLPPVAALRWPVREFSLIESIPSRPYQVLRTWWLD